MPLTFSTHCIVALPQCMVEDEWAVVPLSQKWLALQSGCKLVISVTKLSSWRLTTGFELSPID